MLGGTTKEKTQKHTRVVLVVIVLLGLLVFTTALENGNTALIAGRNCKRRKQKMSKERSWSTIISAIMIVICEVLMTISLCKNEWIAAFIWKSNFDIRLVNVALNLLLYRIETKEDDEK